jgi:hypothetical protein
VAAVEPPVDGLVVVEPLDDGVLVLLGLLLVLLLLLEVLLLLLALCAPLPAVPSLGTVSVGGPPGTSSAVTWPPPQPAAASAGMAAIRNSTVRSRWRIGSDQVSGAARPCGGRTSGSR